MEFEEVKSIIEALLFVAGKPLTSREIRDILEEVDIRTVKRALESLREEYQRKGGGFQIFQVAHGYQMRTLPQYAPWLKKLFQSRSRSRLSPAALETLAIVAYKQPVSRAEIEAIRGVNVSEILRHLLEIKLIRIMGRKKVMGRPLIYGTTSRFLEYFGLSSLSELPKLEEFERPYEKVRENERTEVERTAQSD